jgi:hypothetical protein
MKATVERIKLLACIGELLRVGGSYHRRFVILLFGRPVEEFEILAREKGSTGSIY